MGTHSFSRTVGSVWRGRLRSVSHSPVQGPRFERALRKRMAIEPIDEVNTRMIAQVIRDVAADVLGVVEAENRPSLDRFSQELLGGQ